MAAAPSFTDEDIAKARNCFARGKELADKKNFDYAIEMYLSGLEYWPDAVEEGHKPCWAAAKFRGPKKVSFTDGMKYKTGGKDFKRAMLNAERLLTMDTNNVGYMEAMFKNAAKAGFYQTVMWIGALLADAASRSEKPNIALYQVMREVYEEVGDRNTDSDYRLAVDALERGVGALERIKALKPTDMAIAIELRDLAGKLTIVRGKFQGDSFKDSVRDEATQRELHDKERGYVSDERMEDQIAKARAGYEANPKQAEAIYGYVDALSRREDEANESKAIGVLLEAYRDTGEYRYKLRADDIRMKQYARKARSLATAGDKQAAREHRIAQLRFELGVFKERTRIYPTDLRIRYHYGVRLFQAGRYDKAIPLLQEARNDPKARHSCSLYIGRCFYEKNYYPPGINTLREAIAGYETPDDELGKQLHYWLARSYEGNGDITEALKTYGQLIEWDYNYRNGEVRKRIDDLNKAKSGK